MNNLYQILIEPRSSSKDSRSRELILNYVLLGLITLSATELLTSAFGYLFLDQHYTGLRLVSMLVTFLIFTGLYWMARFRLKQRLVSYVIIIILLIASCSVVANWGNLTPTGILLFSLVVVMAGVLLGSRYALYSAVASMAILATLEYLKAAGVLHPNLAWMERPSSMSDILGFSIIYAVIALVSWLFNKQMEQSLARARQSEAALSKHNETLEATVKKRTQQLEAEQLEKVQQVYRFAEMGRISSALFHDLANHLTSVSLDIEGLDNSKQSVLMRRIQSDIRYVDDVVQRVRLQLRGQGSVEQIKVANEINKVARILNYKLVQSHIKLSVQDSAKPVVWRGDVIPFRQIINNLLTNAVEAYEKSRSPKRQIVVSISQDDKFVTLDVTDWGIGIPAQQQAKVFEPFFSNKATGTGIGLYIVQQIVERDLGGTIALTSRPKTGTTFTVRLPRHAPKS